jgi:hypothetical protein
MPFGYQKKGNGKERNRNYKIQKWTVQILLFILVTGERRASIEAEGSLGGGAEESWHGIGGDLERRAEAERSGGTPVTGERRSGGVAPSTTASLSRGER